MRVRHVTTTGAWAEARRHGRVVAPGLAAEGFTHCCTDEQLAGVLERHFAGVDPSTLVVLDVDLDRVGAEVRWEDGGTGDGERFPHVYGPIPTAAVVGAEPS
jgi:uncharacterized protein (DUF952 family)